ncbi:MAG: NAD(P)/FAD-dependent oxidoreductase [Candidatus Bathyarchaeia archaeon]
MLEEYSMYDVIVIGGGPSGLMAAKKSSELSTKTLLVEKEGAFGSKPCAEGISKQTVLDAELTPSSSFVENEITEVEVYAPDENKKVNILRASEGDSGYIINKKAFLETLAESAKSKGTEIWMNAKAIDVFKENDLVKVIVQKDREIFKLKSRIVIGCDGFASIVAKKFFDRKNYELISCIQYTMDGCRLEKENRMEIYLGKERAPLGYLWIFPKGNKKANVGVGVRKGVAKFYLDKFIKDHPEKFEDSRVIKVGGAPVPISGTIDEFLGDNLMLCGDAAGQVIPLTGAGIHTSIIAGKIAGEVAGKAIKAENASRSMLVKYAERFNEVYGNRIKKSLKGLRVIEKLSDEELNMLADILKGQDIIDIANGLDVERVAKFLFQHPIFSIKMAKLLLSK